MSEATPSSLVKYCTYDTGIKILSEQTLRWSSPQLFRDPFELHYASENDVSAPRLLDVLLRDALIMLFGPEAPIGRNNKLVNVMARWREEQRFCDEDEAATVLRELLGQIAELQAHHVDEYMADWRRFARSIRICTFSERAHLLPCWERFAGNHTGLALRFESGEETGLPAPRQVVYQSSAPVVTSLREQIDTVLGRRLPPDRSDFHQKLLSKGRHQLAEMEWRCFDSVADEPDTDESLWYSNRKFPAHELRNVYLGVRMARAERDVIIRLVRRNYPSVKIHQAAPISGRFELDFVPLGRQ